MNTSEKTIYTCKQMLMVYTSSGYASDISMCLRHRLLHIADEVFSTDLASQWTIYRATARTISGRSQRSEGAHRVVSTRRKYEHVGPA